MLIHNGNRIEGAICDVKPSAVHQRHAAVLKGDAGDDLSQGHSLMKNSEARAVQERFLILAKRHLEILRTVLRSSVDGNQRAIAANVLGYVSDKRSVLDDLLYAVRDPAD